MVAAKRTSSNVIYKTTLLLVTILLAPFAGATGAADSAKNFEDYCEYHMVDENDTPIDGDYINNSSGSLKAIIVDSDKQYIRITCDASRPRDVVIATLFSPADDGSGAYRYETSYAYTFDETPVSFPVNLAGATVDPVNLLLAWTLVLDGDDSLSTVVDLVGHSAGDSQSVYIDEGIDGYYGDDNVQCSNGLDVAFLIDDTGSMTPYINNVKSELQTLADTIESRSNDNYRLSLWTFKDDSRMRLGFSPQNIDNFSQNLSNVYAHGGGDWFEASLATMQEANQTLEWRGEEAAKIIFIITDAPPHATVTQAGDVAQGIAESDLRIAAIHVGSSALAGVYLESYAENSSGVYAQVSSPGDTTGILSTVVDAMCMDEPSGMTPMASLSEIAEVVIYEQTGATYTHHFAMSGATLEKLQSDVDEGNGEFDFSSVVSERYDVYISDHKGNVDENGSFLTIDSYYHGVQANNAAGMNIDAVGLRLTDNSTIWADNVTNVEIGEDLSGMYYATHGYATRILGEADDLSTRLGNKYSTITVGFEEFMIIPTPEDEDEGNSTEDSDSSDEAVICVVCANPYIRFAKLRLQSNWNHLVSIKADDLAQNKSYQIEWYLIAQSNMTPVDAGTANWNAPTMSKIVSKWQYDLENGEYCVVAMLYQEGVLVDKTNNCYTVSEPPSVTNPRFHDSSPPRIYEQSNWKHAVRILVVDLAYHQDYTVDWSVTRQNDSTIVHSGSKSWNAGSWYAYRNTYNLDLEIGEYCVDATLYQNGVQVDNESSCYTVVVDAGVTSPILVYTQLRDQSNWQHQVYMMAAGLTYNETYQVYWSLVRQSDATVVLEGNTSWTAGSKHRYVIRSNIDLDEGTYCIVARLLENGTEVANAIKCRDVEKCEETYGGNSTGDETTGNTTDNSTGNTTSDNATNGTGNATGGVDNSTADNMTNSTGNTTDNSTGNTTSDNATNGTGNSTIDGNATGGVDNSTGDNMTNNTDNSTTDNATTNGTGNATNNSTMGNATSDNSTATDNATGATAITGAERTDAVGDSLEKADTGGMSATQPQGNMPKQIGGQSSPDTSTSAVMTPPQPSTLRVA